MILNILQLCMQQKISQIEMKIKGLQHIKSALLNWEQACDGKVFMTECPILEALYSPPENIRGYLQQDQ